MSRSSQFSSAYVVSLLLALLSVYGVSKANPNMSVWITYVIVPLAVAYVSLRVINAVMPGVNRTGSKIVAYVDHKTLGEINSMGYVQVFPPLLAVTILVFILLFTKKLHR